MKRLARMCANAAWGVAATLIVIGIARGRARRDAEQLCRTYGVIL